MEDDERRRHWIAHEFSEVAGKELGAGYQATVTVHDSPWGKLVVKRARRHWPFGRSGTDREFRVYERLAGIPGIPVTYGCIDDSGLVLEYIAGESLRNGLSALRDRDRFFDRMLQTIDAMHAAGVAHCDLKRKDNTIVGADETPYLIDFGIACILEDGDGWAKRRWFELMRQMDYNAWVKLRFGRRPVELPPDVAARYNPLWIEKLARWIRIPWQKLTLRRLRNRWKDRD